MICGKLAILWLAVQGLAFDPRLLYMRFAEGRLSRTVLLVLCGFTGNSRAKCHLSAVRPMSGAEWRSGSVLGP